MELSNAGRPKRKGRQDISYKLFYSENVSEEEMEEFFSKRNDRLAGRAILFLVVKEIIIIIIIAYTALIQTVLSALQFINSIKYNKT